MPKQWASRTRLPKLPLVPMVEWEKFPPAVQDEHWARESNPTTLRSIGKGYACKILNDDRCDHFVKKSAFEDHMRSVHRLNPEPCRIGRSKTSTRKRYPVSEEGKQRNAQSTLGVWPPRLWKQKIARMKWLIRWANKQANQMEDGTEKIEWIMNLVHVRYDQWRKSEDFRQVQELTIENCIKWWHSHFPDADPEYVKSKIEIPSDLDGWSSDDGCPIVDLENSDFQRGEMNFYGRKKLPFKNRMIKERQFLGRQTTTHTRDTHRSGID